MKKTIPPDKEKSIRLRRLSEWLIAIRGKVKIYAPGFAQGYDSHLSWGEAARKMEER